MSTTSTTFNNCKRSKQDCTSTRTKANKNEYYAELMRKRQEVDEGVPLKKSSRERVLEELSTFIAEFSNLTDGQDSKAETPNSPVRSYNGRLVESRTQFSFTSEENGPFYHKHTRAHQKNHNRRRKSVEWFDQRIPYRNRSTNENTYSETPVETSEREKPYFSTKPRDSDYVFDQPKQQSPNKWFKHEKRENRSSNHRRPRSTFNRRMPYHDGRLIRFRVESNERSRKLPNKKVRVNKSKSLVRYWPFRYDKNKRKYRIDKNPQGRKQKCIPIERKVEIPSESPTVITLYPKNSRKPQKSPDEIIALDFLADPDLPCKCFKCMRQYELLQQISDDEPNIVYYQPRNEGQSMTVRDEDIESHPRNLLEECKKCPCSKKQRNGRALQHPKNNNQMENSSFRPEEHKCTPAYYKNACCCNETNERNNTKHRYNLWQCTKNLLHCSMPPPTTTNQLRLPLTVFDGCYQPRPFCKPFPTWRHQTLKPCPHPCDDDNCMTNWNLNEIRSCDEQGGESSYKSVYFRFDCVGHQINPAVTKYFQSILNNKIY